MKKHIKLDYSFSSENLSRILYNWTKPQEPSEDLSETGFKDEFLYTAHKFANCS